MPFNQHRSRDAPGLGPVVSVRNGMHLVLVAGHDVFSRHDPIITDEHEPIGLVAEVQLPAVRYLEPADRLVMLARPVRSM